MGLRNNEQRNSLGVLLVAQYTIENLKAYHEAKGLFIFPFISSCPSHEQSTNVPTQHAASPPGSRYVFPSAQAPSIT